MGIWRHGYDTNFSQFTTPFPSEIVGMGDDWGLQSVDSATDRARTPMSTKDPLADLEITMHEGDDTAKETEDLLMAYQRDTRTAIPHPR